MYEFRGFYIPERMMGELERYIEYGINPGGFLCSVIDNDLYRAVANADDENVRNLPAYVGYLYNKAPNGCWGSKKIREAWVESVKSGGRVVL